MTFSLQEPTGTSIPDCVPAFGKRVFISRKDTPLAAGTSTGRAQDEEKERLHELIKTGIFLANFVQTVLKVHVCQMVLCISVILLFGVDPDPD
jgi:hypothetical protein